MRTWIIAALLLTSTSALAGQTQCPTESDRHGLSLFRDRIERAPTPEKAKKLALSKLKLGHQAIDVASRTVGDAAALSDAEAKLDALETAVHASETQDQVSAAFGGLDKLGSGCDYGKGEIAIIVVGFILGIIPGIILLFVFC
jgi:hypothetical protein